MKYKNYLYIGQAILAAALFGLSAPFSKLLLEKLSPYLLSSLLYLGAGIGMFCIDVFRKLRKRQENEARLTKKELPFILLMILLDIAAPIFLMFGLTMTTPATASLLNNFEIVATSVIALVFFKEAIGRRLFLAIILIIFSSTLLSVNDFSSLRLSLGSLLVLVACVCWGLENNCTRKLSIKDPLQIVIIKGMGSGIGALTITFLLNNFTWVPFYLLLALILGFFAYGLSIFFYVSSQRHLGAARTSAYYAIAPFIGVGISFILFNESITLNFIMGLVFMIIATYFLVSERHTHKHKHPYLAHEHKHNHHDGHHSHTHDLLIKEEHSHFHIHEEMEHHHSHTPDLHHQHEHSK